MAEGEMAAEIAARLWLHENYGEGVVLSGGAVKAPDLFLGHQANGPGCQEPGAALDSGGGRGVEPCQSLGGAHPAGTAHAAGADHAVVGQLHDGADRGVAVQSGVAERIQPGGRRVLGVEHLAVTRFLLRRQAEEEIDPEGAAYAFVVEVLEGNPRDPAAELLHQDADGQRVVAESVSRAPQGGRGGQGPGRFRRREVLEGEAAAMPGRPAWWERACRTVSRSLPCSPNS